MGLFSALAGVFGGGAQKKAARAAAEQQTLALNRAIDIQNNQFQQTRSDFLPYTQAGSAAMNELSQLITGFDGDSAGLTARIKADPLYESTYRNGEEALLQNAAATGGLRGGNTQRGLADFSADTLGKVYQQILSNLGGVANLGLGATGSVAGFGANAANATSGFATDIGNAQVRGSDTGNVGFVPKDELVPVSTPSLSTASRQPVAPAPQAPSEPSAPAPPASGGEPLPIGPRMQRLWTSRSLAGKPRRTLQFRTPSRPCGRRPREREKRPAPSSSTRPRRSVLRRLGFVRRSVPPT
ncbi:hypothetical protein [Sphingomonas sp. Mn802worker]|uniref:hypothetical protein n=1 Tax=Sphingomonas sp. Mn802worker TaxID=629773 RepID=UPI003FD3ECD8